MKMLILLSAVFFLFSEEIYADKIFLQDGTFISGSIKNVTKNYIEYQPDNARRNEFFPRGQIYKIFYSDGHEIILNESNKNIKEYKTDFPVFTEETERQIPRFFYNKNIQEKKEWNGRWYLGFGIGIGNGGWSSEKYRFAGNNWLESPLSFNFDTGIIITPGVFAGFSYSYFNGSHSVFLSSLQDDDFIHYNYYITNQFLAVQYFPFHNKGAGLFFKLGAGLTRLEITLAEYDAGETTKYTERYRGYGAMLGLGYMFWMGKIFNGGLHIEYYYQLYNNKNKDNPPWDSSTEDNYTYIPSKQRPKSCHMWNIYFSFYLI
jgi:hypothetical protein